jgi:autotransporter-associated beta strand protein
MAKSTGSFDIAAGTTQSGTTWTLNDTNTGIVETGATLTSSTKNPEVTFGNGTTSLTNSGTISSTGDRALDASGLAAGSNITVTNNAGAEILGLFKATGASGENNDAFKISDDFSGGSVTINNSGYLVAGNVDSSGNIVLANGASTSGQAIDFADVASSLVTINNNHGGVIGAADSDAIRAGDDAIINNHGEIISQNASAASSGNDGIDLQTTNNLTTGNVTINNFSDGTIIGARHGITGKFAITVNNDGTITGQLGSGINLDTVSGTTDVVNHGTISGTSGGAQDGDAIDVDYLLDLENYGSVQAFGTSTSGSLSEAVTIGGGTINNYATGVIESVQRAITVDDSNDGNAPGSTTIYNEGSIIGGNGQAISITDTLTDIVTNKGVITGSVSLGGGDDFFNNYTGSTLTGQLDGGDGHDTLNLLGTGKGTFGDVINFEALDVEGGTWKFSDDETFSSGVTIDLGTTLRIGTGGSTGTLSGAIDDEGTLVFDRSGNLTISDAITGGGAVVQNGPGTTLLSAQNSYTGGTTLKDGTLDVGALNGAGTGAITFKAGTTLRIEDAALQNGDFSNIIKGFAVGDIIDLANSDATKIKLGANNVLTISGGTTGTVRIHLAKGESFAGDVFHLQSDGGSGLFITETEQPCYCRGTLILTDRGERLVEELEIGDRLVTLAGAQRPIKWIGRRGYAGRYILGRQDILPICIKPGALGDGVPRRDLWISPLHAMFLENVLIEARDLVNDVSIVQATQVEEVEYFHLELDTHDVIIAEGAPSETFIDDGSRMMFRNAHEYALLYPNEPRNPPRFCAPRLNAGYEVEAARRHIDTRAGLRTPDAANFAPEVRGFVDLLATGRVAGWVQAPDQPDAPLCVDILAAGCRIGRALANVYREDLAAAGIGHGRYGFELALPAGVDLATVEVRCTLADTGLPLTNAARGAIAAAA